MSHRLHHLAHAHLSYALWMRVCLAGAGIILGAGRLADYGRLAQTSGLVSSDIFGLALLTSGLALALTARWRLTVWGRIGAAWAVAGYSFMAAGTWGATVALLYGWLALCCFAEVAARRQDDC